MKKMLIALSCVFSLCLVSCASKQPETPTDSVAAPETTEDTQENETEVSEESENTTEAEEDFPELESIDEPEIITLEPEDIVEESSDKSSEAENSEIIENEEPPAIVEETEKTTESDTTMSGTSESPDSSETKDSDIDITIDSEDDSNEQTDNTTSADDVIDITNDDSSTEEYNEKAAIAPVEPSRSVTLKKFEYLDVTYPGTGWIYMGLTDNSKDLAYFGRKLGTKDTKFSLQARNSGTKIIHFYKNDPLTGQYIDDYIEVIITTESGSNKTHIEAPEYKIPVKKKESKKTVKEEITEEEKSDTNDKETSSAKESNTTNAKTSSSKTTNSTDSTITSNKSSNTATNTTAAASKTSDNTSSTDSSNKSETAANTEVQTTEVSTPADPSTLLKEAQLLYNENEFSAALNKINQFLEFAADKRDEGLYLKGQILEAKSNVRDIKGALEAYTSLTKNYPASKLWDSANKRIIYLKRFYMEVR